MSSVIPLPKAPSLSVQPLDQRALRNALGAFATGVTIITTRLADGRVVGLTVNSFASVSLDPPLVLWSQSRTSASFPAFAAAERFVVNVLAENQKDLALQFARSSADKFAGLAYDRGLGDVPILRGTAATFQCRSLKHHDGGDHVIHLGAVEDFVHHSVAPLLFSRGQFGSFVAQ